MIGSIRGTSRLLSVTRRVSLQYRNFSKLIDDSNAIPERSAKIIDECLEVRKSLQDLNDRVKGPLEKNTQKNTIMPFVFLLGNHSSGKSSFVNYVCQRKIQVAGVAPTDDSFTIIAPGPADVDRDGPAFINDPDMGFNGLRVFGPQLIHHTELKVRSSIANKNFMIVDSPGMIDSPMVRDRQGDKQRAVMERGYDFENVCRWYAERADVILLFFDPDKPGTTGETLQILTNSLVGLDQKLHIVLNKADQFQKIHDFARAYGSLCWNLSKVIQRKDLPQIYTMCLPSNYQSRSQPVDYDQPSLGKGLLDLEATREEVVAKVLNAPFRRIDNEISRLSDSVSILQMHCKVMNDIRQRYRKKLFKSRLFLSLAPLSGAGLVSAMLSLDISLQTVGVSGGVFAAVMGGSYWWQVQSLQQYATMLVTETEIENTFKRLYARSLAEKDEFIVSVWHRVRDHFRLSLTASELQSMSNITANDLKKLDEVIEKDIPALRRKAAPVYNK